MTARRILNIIIKEWQVTFSDVNSTLMITLLPLIILIQGLLYVWLISRFGTGSLLSNRLVLDALQNLLAALPAAAELPPGGQLLLLLLTQFNFYLLLIPLMITVNLTTFSIVEEKLFRSLEPLLATPVKTWELLLGKALSGALPAVAITWICALLFQVGVAVMGWGELVQMVINPTWFISLLLLNPAVTVLSFLLGIIGSSRARDFRSAQNLVVIIILPLLALIGVQVTGLVWFTPLLTVILGVFLGVINLLALKVAVRLFQRESIILQWR
ncbi:MAG TPA: ABC transporter permease subunit [Firmicutes bacterium]|nr:ABC transporter permease subunit [Bacillota bacterium]